MTMAGARRTINTGKADHEQKNTVSPEKGRIPAWDRQIGKIPADQPLEITRDHRQAK